MTRVRFVSMWLGAASTILLAMLAIRPCNAQSTPVSSSIVFAGVASGVFGEGLPNVTGVAGFGSLTVDASFTFSNGSLFHFTFSDGSTMDATGSGSASGAHYYAGSATITGGTLSFAGASGSFTFTFVCPADCAGQKGTSYQGNTNGTGTLTVAGPYLGQITGPAGSPTSSEPSGPGYTVSGPGGSGYPAEICVPASAGSGGPLSACTSVAFDGAGASGSSVLVFEGSGSSGSSVLVFDGSGGSGSSVLTFEGSGGSGSSVLVFDGSGGSGSSVDRPCERCDAADTTQLSSAQLEILTPLQSNDGTYTVSADCGNSVANCWVTFPQPTGSIAASSRGGITAIVNPQGLSPGVYSANVSIAISPAFAAPTTVTVPLQVIVTANAPLLSVSQSGLQFEAVSGSSASQHQFISVANSGSGSLLFTATSATASGGNWLTISPASGAAPANIGVTANPAGLAPGEYFGTVQLSAAGTANAQQTVDVVLRVTAPSSSVPLISPNTVSFVAAGTSTPAPQVIQVLNPSSQTLTMSTSLTDANGNGWLAAAASESSLAPGQSAILSLTATPAGLASGEYSATLDIHFAEINTDYLVTAELVVPNTTQTGGGASGTCTPTRLLPAFTNLEAGFVVPAGVPVPIQVSVIDDCGSELNSGSVVAYFPGTSDPPVALTALNNGQWTGTWTPHELTQSPVSAGVIASASGTPLYGSAGANGTVMPNSQVPLIASGGVVSAASLATGEPLAPGSYITIFGSNLATTSQAAASLPLPASTNGTQVFLGGEPLPLQYAGPGQINALVPYNVQLNSVQQLIVVQNGFMSLPEPVSIAATEPAVFTQDQSGTGAGAVVVVKFDGTQFLNTPSAPASVGDALVIYASGLGSVSPAVLAGSAAPASPLSQTTNAVTVMIGGQSAPVLFSGLTPGYAGLYQVNVTVPPGIASGSAVPLVLSAAAQSSRPVTVAIQ